MPSSWSTRACIAGTLWCCAAGRLGGQGITVAGVQGTVLQADSLPVAEATVLITNVATGERWQTLTRSNGRFFLDHLSIGGPYQLDVHALGFTPAERAGVFLSLAQRVTADFYLAATAYQLDEVRVHASADPRMNTGRTGPALTLSQSSIARLPVPT